MVFQWVLVLGSDAERVKTTKSNSGKLEALREALKLRIVLVYPTSWLIR